MKRDIRTILLGEYEDADGDMTERVAAFLADVGIAGHTEVVGALRGEWKRTHTALHELIAKGKVRKHSDQRPYLYEWIGA